VRDAAARQRHGASYAARDPELSLWVHATLVDSTIVAADAWLEPLSSARRERYYQETRPIGRAFGIPDGLLPADYPAFDAYLARMLGPTGPVQVGPTARALAPYVLRPPLGPVVPLLGWVPRDVYSWVLWPSIGLLPASVRHGYGLPWGPLQQAVSRWLVAGYRLWRPAFPTGLRWMPQARAADRRSAAAAGASRPTEDPATS
jgi:uncharacterized protein (DUF2236 family)